ncbi:MAG: zinc-ribbon domain-containing protein [Candidatus Hodarchaeales archaeon]
MLIGFVGMFAAPLYYWVFNPDRDSKYGPYEYHPNPSPHVSSGKVPNFCVVCGSQNIDRNRFCDHCGENLVIH